MDQLIALVILGIILGQILRHLVQPYESRLTRLRLLGMYRARYWERRNRRS